MRCHEQIAPTIRIDVGPDCRSDSPGLTQSRGGLLGHIFESSGPVVSIEATAARLRISPHRKTRTDEKINVPVAIKIAGCYGTRIDRRVRLCVFRESYRLEPATASEIEAVTTFLSGSFDRSAGREKVGIPIIVRIKENHRSVDPACVLFDPVRRAEKFS